MMADPGFAHSGDRYFLSTSRGMLPKANKQVAPGYYDLDKMARIEILLGRHWSGLIPEAMSSGDRA